MVKLNPKLTIQSTGLGPPEREHQDSPTLSGLSSAVAGTSMRSPAVCGGAATTSVGPSGARGPSPLSAGLGATSGAPAAAASAGASGADTKEVQPAPSAPSGSRPLSPSKRKHAERTWGEDAATEPADASSKSSAAPRSSVETGADAVADESERPQSPTKRLRPSAARAARPPVRVTDLFAPGMVPGRVFRIPSLLPVPGPERVVLAFAEARQTWHDSGSIDLVGRRSTDGGATCATVPRRDALGVAAQL